jgi:hypothetical protein
MIDLVTAGPFTFCPSMFVAAYIEAAETETTSNTNSETGNSSRGIGGVDYKSGTNSFNSGTYQIANGLIVTGTRESVNATATRIPETDSSNKTLTTAGSKTVTANSVILVLTTGAYKAKTSDPQNVISAIYSQVATYFNSLP